MPGNKNNPQCALSAGFDATAWAAGHVFQRSGVDTDLDAAAGRFEDAAAFLNGHASGESFGVDLQDAWTTAGGSGTITAGISSSDKFTITADGDFTIGAGATAYGFDAGGHGLVGGGGPTYSRAAPNDWTRGTWDFATRTLTITPSGGSPFTVPRATRRGRAQSLIVALRGETEGDADDVLATLQMADNAANSTSYIRWGITDDGFVYYTRPSGVAAAITFWTSTTFRDRLGFSGRETETLSGGVYTKIAERPLPGFLLPVGLRRFTGWYDETTPSVELTDGDAVGYQVARVQGYQAEFWVAGPAQGTTRDRERHLRERFWRYVPLAGPITVYREWGETRRALAEWEYTSSQPRYDLLYTTERDGERGRVILKRDPKDETRRLSQYPGDVRNAQLVQMLLRQVP